MQRGIVPMLDWESMEFERTTRVEQGGCVDRDPASPTDGPVARNRYMRIRKQSWVSVLSRKNTISTSTPTTTTTTTATTTTATRSPGTDLGAPQPHKGVGGARHDGTGLRDVRQAGDGPKVCPPAAAPVNANCRDGGACIDGEA